MSRFSLSVTFSLCIVLISRIDESTSIPDVVRSAVQKILGHKIFGSEPVKEIRIHVKKFVVENGVGKQGELIELPAKCAIGKNTTVRQICTLYKDEVMKELDVCNNLPTIPGTVMEEGALEQCLENNVFAEVETLDQKIRKDQPPVEIKRQTTELRFDCEPYSHFIYDEPKSGVTRIVTFSFKKVIK